MKNLKELQKEIDAILEAETTESLLAFLETHTPMQGLIGEGCYEGMESNTFITHSVSASESVKSSGEECVFHNTSYALAA